MMSFTGKDNLDGALRIVQDAFETLDIAEDQRGSLVGSKAPCKANDERIRIEHILDLANLCRAFAQAEMLALQAAACILNKLLFTPNVCLPEFRIRNIVDMFIPECLLINITAPIWIKVASKHLSYRLPDP